MRAVNMYEAKTGIYCGTFDSVERAARIMGVSQSLITMACQGKKKTIAGATWKYADEEKPKTRRETYAGERYFLKTFYEKVSGNI